MQFAARLLTPFVDDRIAIEVVREASAALEVRSTRLSWPCSHQFSFFALLHLVSVLIGRAIRVTAARRSTFFQRAETAASRNRDLQSAICKLASCEKQDMKDLIWVPIGPLIVALGYFAFFIVVTIFCYSVRAVETARSVWTVLAA